MPSSGTSQRHVTGEVRLRLDAGRCWVVGRRSPVGLYDHGLATYDSTDTFRHQDAEGFVRLWGLGVATWSAVQEGRGGDRPTGRSGAMTLWHGRLGDGTAEEVMRVLQQPPFRPARWPTTTSPPRGPTCVGSGAAASSPRTRWSRCSPPWTRWKASSPQGRSSSPSATRTSTPRSSAGSPRSPAMSGPSCTPAGVETTRSPPICACSPSGSCAAWPAEIVTLQEVLADRARDAGDAYLPGYTHLQRAQPVLLAHHLLAHGWALARDVDRLLATVDRLDVSPLGAGALAGSSLPLDPDGVASRSRVPGPIRELARCRVGPGFRGGGALRSGAARRPPVPHRGGTGRCGRPRSSASPCFADAYATGSSMLPQKKNPDVAELARGKSGRLIGNLTGLLATLKGLPLAYNRDLQEDKEPLFDSVEQTHLALAALAGLLSSVTFVDRPDAGGGRRRGRGRRGPGRVAGGAGDALPPGPCRRRRPGAGLIERHVPLAELVEAHPALGAKAVPLLEPGVP